MLVDAAVRCVEKTRHHWQTGDDEQAIESLWDVTTAVTAYARRVGYQDRRVELERQAGDIMALAA